MSHKTFGGLDRFRFLASFFVIAIHISPLSALSPDADFFLTRILSRLAVPFFFLVTGYFVLGEGRDCGRVRRFLLRTSLLYLLSIVLYLPFGLYAGHYEKLTAGGLLRMIFFDGTFYHLWYFPACILGVSLTALLTRRFSRRTTMVAAGFLYLAGLLGDSYYGLASSVPALASFYDALFQVFSFTRNGLFFAPLFLVIGARLSDGSLRLSRRECIPGFLLSFALMTAEAFLLRKFQSPRHDSMYLFLVPSMVFLFHLLLSMDREPSKRLRTASSWIYILHPAVLIALRMAAKPLGLTGLLVENPLVQFLSVSLFSALTAFCVAAFLPPVSNALRQSRRRPETPREVLPSSGHPRRPFSGSRAWIELDLAALRSNVAYLKGLLPADCRLMPAVKADAYGHGSVFISRELNRLGVDAFCVACAKEGARLRKHGITGEILILGYTHPSQFPLLVRYHLTQTVVDVSYGERLNAFGQPLHVHVGMDTGMRRLGERSENLDRLQRLWQMEHLIIDGVFTHLCTADGQTEREEQYVKEQADAFYRGVGELKKRGCLCPRLHLLSSYGLLRYPGYAEDYARVGIALYGILSDKKDTAAFGAALKPVLSLKARIAAVKTLHAGESAGYGIAYTAEEERTIAVLTIGYADGLPRSFSCGKGHVLVNGRKVPILGRVCMDQTVVDVTGIPNVRAGKPVTIIGSWKGETITVCDWAEAAGTITNEILSRLGGRLERICTNPPSDG